MESEILLDNQDKINNTIYLKNNRLLVVSYSDKIILYDIENIKGRPIQIIYTNSYFLYNFNKNIFISYTFRNMQLYEIINGQKYYQLLNVYKFQDIEQLIKLNNNLLLVLKNNNLYTININTMKTNKIYLLYCQDKIEIKYICNDKNYLYLYINNIIYYIQYFHNQFQLIKSIKFDKPLVAIDHLCYLKINNNNILIKCKENKNPIYLICAEKIIRLDFLHFISLTEYKEYTIDNFISMSYMFKESNTAKFIISNKSNPKLNYFKIKKNKQKNYNKKNNQKNYNKKKKNYFRKNYR